MITATDWHAPVAAMAEFETPFEFDLTPISDTLFVGRESKSDRWKAVVFDENHLYVGIRAYTRR